MIDRHLFPAAAIFMSAVPSGSQSSPAGKSAPAPRRPSPARFGVCVSVALVMSVGAPVFGQSAPSMREADEKYHVELAAGAWNPTPTLLISSEPQGTNIDLVNISVDRRWIGELRLVVQPVPKHKLRFEYIPIDVETTMTLRRDIIFRETLYQLGLSVDSVFNWTAMRFGYEYDFLTARRGYAGLLIEAKDTNVRVQLANARAIRLANVNALTPTIGGIGRLYAGHNLSFGVELSGFNLRGSENRRAHYVDFDGSGTLAFTKRFGIQFGYRSLDISYDLDTDTGLLKMNGLYAVGLVRY